MIRSTAATVWVLGLAVLLSACDSANFFGDFDAPVEKARVEAAKEAQPDYSNVLRVGMTANYAPVVFRQGKDVAGVEVDLARHLATKMRKSLQMLDMKWDALIPALLDGRIDIIMSGMTITDPRKVRITFSDPYLKTGLFALRRNADASRYNSRASILGATGTVGVIAGTTGDVFVQQHMPDATRWEVGNIEDAVFQLKNGRIDLFVYDAPAIMWIVSENEADLAALQVYLTEEYLGWGIRRGNDELLTNVNQYLAEWKLDGTLEEILGHWLPYRK